MMKIYQLMRWLSPAEWLPSVGVSPPRRNELARMVPGRCGVTLHPDADADLTRSKRRRGGAAVKNNP